MIYREGIAFCCENHTECINVLSGKNTEFFNVKPAVYSILTTRSYGVNTGWLDCHAYAQTTEPVLTKNN
jgi:hypothetical protein